MKVGDSVANAPMNTIFFVFMDGNMTDMELKEPYVLNKNIVCFLKDKTFDLDLSHNYLFTLDPDLLRFHYET